eukprot:UC4_evm1s536
MELERECGACQEQLKTYQTMEDELDGIIMHAADSNDADKVLLTYGYGAGTPTTTKRRLRQSVMLARQVLQLQREKATIEEELEKARIAIKELEVQLKDSESLLKQTTQPANYLIETVRRRDATISILKTENEVQKNEISTLKDLRVKYLKERDIM